MAIKPELHLIYERVEALETVNQQKPIEVSQITKMEETLQAMSQQFCEPRGQSAGVRETPPTCRAGSTASAHTTECIPAIS